MEKFINIVIVFSFIGGCVLGIMSLIPTEEELAQQVQQRDNYFSSLPSEESLFEKRKKCADAGLSVVEDVDYRYNKLNVIGVTCGVPIAQKQSEDMARGQESEVADAAAIVVGGYLVGKVLGF